MVYFKVLEKIIGTPLNGHALINMENKKSLAKAKIKIEKLLKDLEKCGE